MKDLISIIVTFYNAADFAEDALSSVKNQSYKKWECIIIDDGSTDDTISKVQNNIEGDDRFRFFPQINKGVCAARNHGLSQAQGEFLIFLDGDDLLNEFALENAMSAFQDHPDSLVIFSDTTVFPVNSVALPALKKTFSLEELLIKNQLYITALFRKSDLKNAVLFDEEMPHYGEDWEFWISLMLQNPDKKPKKLDYNIFSYRQHEKSAVALFKDDIRNKSFNYIYLKHFEAYSKLFPPFVQNYARMQFFENKLEKIYNHRMYKLYNSFISNFRSRK